MKEIKIRKTVYILTIVMSFICISVLSSAAQTPRKYKVGDRIEVDSTIYEVVECRIKPNTGEEECDVLPHHSDGLTGNIQTILATQLRRYEQQTQLAKKRQGLISQSGKAQNQSKAETEETGKDTAAPNNEATSDEPELTVTAQQLYTEYNNNDTAAKQKYVGKMVRVTGAVIYNISETKFSARFNKTYSGSTIQCLVEDLEQIPTLNKNETVTLIGKPLGSMTSTGVIFEPCRVERKTANQAVRNPTAAKPVTKTAANTDGKIAGTWYYTAIINPDGTEQKLSNSESYLWLKDDGSYENRFGGVGQIGTYTASGNRLTLNRENVGAKTYTMTVSGATMILKSSTGGYKLEKE